MEHPMEKSNEVLNLSINIPPTLPTQPKSETTPWEEHYRELQDLTREEEQALWAAGNSDIDNEDSFKSGAMLSRNSLSESVLGDDMLVEVSEDGFGSEGSLIDLGSDDESEADSESSAILVKGVKKDKGKAIDRQEYEDEFSLSLAAAGEIEVSETEKRKSVDTASTKTKPTLYKLPSADLTFAQRQTGCQQRSMDRAAMVGLKPIVSSSLFPSPKSADVKGESLKDDEVYMKGVFERAFMSFGTTREDIKLLVAAKEADRIVKENARKGMQPTVTDENEELAMETTASANKEEGEFTMYQHAASQVTINTGGSIKMDKELTWPPNYPEKWKPLQLDSQRRLSEATQNRFNIPNFGPRPEEKPQQKSQLQSGTNQKCFNISTFIPRPEEQSEANQPQINTSTFDPLHEKTPRKFQTKPFIALSPVGPALSPPVMKEIIEVSKSNRRRGNIGVKKHKLAREDAASAPSASSTSSITKNKITAESHCAICSQDILSPATMPGCLKYHKSPVSFSKLSQILAESKSHTDGDVNHSSICANNNSHADVPFINAKPSGNSTNRIFHPDLNPALPSFKTSYECHFHISSLSDCGAYSVRTCNASLETPDTTVGAPFPAFFHANKSAPVKNLSSKDSIDKPMNMLKNLRAAGIVQGSSPMATYTNLHGEVFTCNARSYTSCLNLECKLHPRSSDFIANLQVGQIQAQLQAQRQSQAQYQVQLQAQLQAQLQIEAQRSSLAKDKKKAEDAWSLETLQREYLQQKKKQAEICAEHEKCLQEAKSIYSQQHANPSVTVNHTPFGTGSKPQPIQTSEGQLINFGKEAPNNEKSIKQELEAPKRQSANVDSTPSPTLIQLQAQQTSSVLSHLQQAIKEKQSRTNLQAGSCPKCKKIIFSEKEIGEGCIWCLMKKGRTEVREDENNMGYGDITLIAVLLLIWTICWSKFFED